jgi:hypothetical protein
MIEDWTKNTSMDTCKNSTGGVSKTYLGHGGAGALNNGVCGRPYSVLLRNPSTHRVAGAYVCTDDRAVFELLYIWRIVVPGESPWHHPL